MKRAILSRAMTITMREKISRMIGFVWLGGILVFFLNVKVALAFGNAV
jgi:hypothetical protein